MTLCTDLGGLPLAILSAPLGERLSKFLSFGVALKKSGELTSVIYRALL